MYNKIIDSKVSKLPNSKDTSFVYVNWEDLRNHKRIVKNGVKNVLVNTLSREWVKIGELHVFSSTQETSEYTQGTLSESCELKAGEALGMVQTVYVKNATNYSNNYHKFNVEFVNPPVGSEHTKVLLPSESMAARQAFVDAGGYVKFNTMPDVYTNKISKSGGCGVSITTFDQSVFRVSTYSYNDGSYENTYFGMRQTTDFQTGLPCLEGYLHSEYENNPDLSSVEGKSNSVASILIEVYKYKEVPPVTPPSWHTIFEGTRNYDTSTSTTLTWNPGIVEAPEYKFRISFWASSSASNGGSGSSVSGSTGHPNTSLYNNSGSSSTSGSKTMNDFEFDALVDATTFELISLSASTTYGDYVYLRFYFDNRNADKTFEIDTSRGPNNSCDLKITKIEQYY